MKLFFDEDNATGIPKAVRLLKAPDLASLEYPSDEKYPRHRWPKATPDSDWLPWAGRENYLVISQNNRILDTPLEFGLIQPNRVKIVFVENGHTSSWRVFRVLQSKWKWLDEQWHRDGPFVWILRLNGHVEPYDLNLGGGRPPRPAAKPPAAKHGSDPPSDIQGRLGL